LYKSNDNLPKVNQILNHNSSLKNHLNTELKNLEKNVKCNSSKEIANSFLKTNHKPLNPIKNKRAINNTEDKKYSINANCKCFIETNGFKPKEELNLMKKSLFFGNHKELASLDVSNGLKKSYDFATSASTLSHTIMDNNNNNGNQNKKRGLCKSKGKSNNNLAGKDTKVYIPNKRNQSTNQIKRRFFKSTLDANRTKTNINNFQRKNY
jgi:hypothetical protein